MIYERLLHILADESRVQLGVIQDTTDGLLQSAADSPLREALERVHHGVRELSTLISDITDFHAHSAGHLNEAESDFDLRVTMDGMRARFSRSRPQSDWIALTKVRHDVPTLLRGRPARLQDILLGAAAGALNTRSPGTLRIDVSKGWERGDRVELVFCCVLCHQEPPGPEELARFRQVLSPGSNDGPILRQHLRAELARRLAHAGEGSLEAVTTDDGSPAFVVRLPFSMRSVPAAEPRVDSRSTLRGHRALLVDGNEARRSHTDALARLWGLETEAVGSGAAALATLRRAVDEGRPFDLALIDAEIEDMTGMTLGGLIRLEPAVGGTGLVLLFGVGLRGDGAIAEKVGYDAYLPRSLPVPELREALAVVLQRGRPEGGRLPLLTRHSLADRQLEGVQILLVGSDPLGALVLEAVLGRRGIRVERAADLAEAAERCEHQRYGLILLDLEQISASDLSIASGLKALVDERATTPVVALFEASGMGERHDLAGFTPDAAFPKPVDLEHICLFCEGVLFPHLAEAAPHPHPEGVPRVAVVTHLSSDESPTAFEPIWLEESTMGIGTLKLSLIDAYLDEMPGRVERISAAIHAADLATAEREVLSARAMALTIGAVATARCLVALSDQVLEERLPEAHVMLSRFRSEAVRSLAELRETRAKMADQAA